MELKKSIATLKFVKIVMNSIFVTKSLPSFLNFAFVRLFFCFLDFLHCCSNLHQICFFARSSLGFNKSRFKFMTFFRYINLKVPIMFVNFFFVFFIF